MPGWEGSTRKDRLPADWAERRRKVIKRDGGRCQHREIEHGLICGKLGNQVDHIVRGDDHSMSNLQVLCRGHHATKSAREGGQSFTPLRRPPEQHPALG
jgi:5-methylcytosine-specific restriction endonuclease McrA